MVELRVPRRPALARSASISAVDDVLDTGAAAWTARRVALGEAEPLPDPPARYADGWSAAIWV